MNPARTDRADDEDGEPVPDEPTPARSGPASGPVLRFPALTGPSWTSASLDAGTGRVTQVVGGLWRRTAALGPSTSVRLAPVEGGGLTLAVRADGARVPLTLGVLVRDGATERVHHPALLRDLADVLEHHRAGGARTVAVQLRTLAGHAESVGSQASREGGPVTTAGAMTALDPRGIRDDTDLPAPADAPRPEPRGDALDRAVDLREPTSDGQGAAVARLEVVTGVLTPSRRSIRTGPVALDGAVVAVTSWRTRLGVEVRRPLGRRVRVPLVDVRPGRESSQPPAVLRALADALDAHRVRGDGRVVPLLRAQAVHLEAGGAVARSPLAALTRGGSDGVLAAIPDLDL